MYYKSSSQAGDCSSCNDLQLTFVFLLNVNMVIIMFNAMVLVSTSERSLIANSG